MSASLSLIDFFIIATYLVAVLVIGIMSGMGKNVNTTIKDYALGNRSFSTTALTATIVASWISANGTLGLTTEMYNKGWLFGMIFLAYPIGILSTKYTVANRIHHFEGCCSLGDIMQQMFGEKSQTLVGILSFINGIGSVMSQIVALGFVFNYLVGMDTRLGMVIGGGIIVSYAAFGGVRAVITTDVIQFIVLVVAIPIMLHTALSHIGGYDPIFNYTANTDISEFDLWGYLLIAISLCIPRLYPAMIQRFLIAKNTEQLYKSLNITIVIVSAMYVVMILVGIVALYLYPNIDNPSHLFAHFGARASPRRNQRFCYCRTSCYNHVYS